MEQLALAPIHHIRRLEMRWWREDGRRRFPHPLAGSESRRAALDNLVTVLEALLWFVAVKPAVARCEPERLLPGGHVRRQRREHIPHDGTRLSLLELKRRIEVASA